MSESLNAYQIDLIVEMRCREECVLVDIFYLCLKVLPAIIAQREASDVYTNNIFGDIF